MFARERCLREIERVAKSLEGADPARVRSALEYMFLLGEECAREDAMHRACLGFSEARAQREQMMRSFTARPSEPPRT